MPTVITYDTPETYMGFLTYWGDGQLYAIADGSRPGPQAKKGTH